LPSLLQRRVLQALPKDKRGPEQLPAPFLQLVAQLYKVEAEARDAGLGTTALTTQRSERSVPVLDDLERLLLTHLYGVLPGSLLGKALHYMASRWAKLKRYVDDGAYPIETTPAKTRSGRSWSGVKSTNCLSKSRSVAVKMRRS